jgi:flagellar basal body-associated protein FliL
MNEPAPNTATSTPSTTAEPVKEPMSEAKASASARVPSNLVQFPRAAYEGVKEITANLKDDLPKARRMAAYFWVNVLGVAPMVFSGFYHYFAARAEHKSAIAAVELAAREKHEALITLARPHQQDLGTFQVEIKSMASAPSTLLYVAELDASIECETRAACEYVKEHMIEIRDDITSVLRAMSYEEVLSKPGKRKLKSKIQDVLNSRVPAGTGAVRGVHFSRLVVV